jgi:hypothetical protein
MFSAALEMKVVRRQGNRHLLYSVCLAASLAAFAPSGALAAVYLVGPDEALNAPSQAARVVKSGDTVLIKPKPGGYYDCAIWRADELTIEGIGDDVRLTDMTCQGKAIFITVGNRITVRNLTFARARVPDRNGAGIRAEGVDLRVEHSRFINNESAILATNSARSRITLKDSQFTDNGSCGPDRCSDAIAVGHIAELSVSDCAISGTRGGDAIRSLAEQTTLISNHIEDGQSGTAAFLVELPSGGSLDMRQNVLARGPRQSGQGTVVRIMQGVGASAVASLALSANTVRNDTRAPLVFVANWTRTAARMQDNHLPSDVTLSSSSGYWWFLTKSAIHRSIALAHDGFATTKALARKIYRHL